MHAGLGFAAAYGLRTALLVDVVRETAAGVLGRSAAEVAQLWRETHERSAYLGSSGALAWGIGVVDVALLLDVSRSAAALREHTSALVNSVAASLASTAWRPPSLERKRGTTFR